MLNKTAQLYENMAMLVKGGVPILRAVQICARGMPGRAERTFEQIHDQMQQGDDLSKCMQSHPKLFEPLDCTMVHIGEVSGSLDEAFEQLALWHRYRERLEKLWAGKAREFLNLSRFCRVFSMLYSAGVPVAQTMELALKTVNHPHVRRRLAGGLNAARSGAPISEGFSPKLPVDFLQLWQVGEQTAELESVTRRLSDEYWQNALRHLEMMTEWVPKLLYAIAVLAMLIIFALICL